MKLNTAVAIAVAGAFAVPFAAQASAPGDRIILAQSAGSTQEPRDSNPAAPPRTFGPGSKNTNPATGETHRGTSSSGFSGMDKNSDGHISRDESKDATWSNRFTELDKDNDGRLSQSEFNAMQAGSAATGATGAAGPSGVPSTRPKN